MGTPHTLPMSKQTTNILNKAKEIATKKGIKCKYVFPICNIKPDKDGFIHQHISISGIQNRLKLYIKIPGSILTPHGFRSMLKTRLKEGISQDGSTDMEDHNKYYSKELTEKALGHKDKVLEETYDRGEYLIRIKTMYQDWADYLDSLSSP
jgi:integrase